MTNCFFAILNHHLIVCGKAFFSSLLWTGMGHVICSV